MNDSMRLIVFSHPTFMNSQSMPRFARLLAEGMRARGHQVDVWSPQPGCWKLSTLPAARKWLGYVDQYVLFPAWVRRQLRKTDPGTLFVFADNALGPWVPLVANRPHVVHCHDFLAQQSALGQIPQNPTSWTGQQYQSYIRRGYRQARHFISVSGNTRRDLHGLLTHVPTLSEVVYNGLNGPFEPGDEAAARAALSAKTGIDLAGGYLVHIGGNQWYKNRVGVVKLYDAWRAQTVLPPLPLLLIGETPNDSLIRQLADSPFRTDIHVVTGLSDEFVRLAYQGGSLFLFPSLSEGFGWPIAEAMASGCPVLTTNADPMREVAGEAGFLIDPMPTEAAAQRTWAEAAATTIDRILAATPAQRQASRAHGLANARRFDSRAFYEQIEQLYRQILSVSDYNRTAQ